MARPTLTAQQTAEVRERLLDAAQALYETGGLDVMSLRAIATSYGCSATMPYSYFASKADVVDGLRIRAYEWIHDVLSVASSSADDPVAALNAMAMAYVEAGVDRSRMYDLLYTSDGAMAETEPVLLEAKTAALGVCERVVREAAESGGVELVTDSETAAHLFWTAAHGLVSLELGGFLVVGRSIEELLPSLFATMVRGLTGEVVVQRSNAQQSETEENNA